MTAVPDHDLVLVVDFGAQYAQLIARRVREARVYSEIVPHTMPIAEMLERNPKAIILSGGPSSVYAEGAPGIDGALFDAQVPVFGMCYGFQLMASALGGEVAPTGAREYGRTPVEVTDAGTLLRELPEQHNVWMSHGDSVVAAPDGFAVLASTEGTPVAAFEHVERQFAGVQWHPEVLHSEHGQKVLEHFLHDIAGCRQTWTMVNIVEEQIARIQEQIGEHGRAICGLSGGVDSAVAAAIVQRAIGDRLDCVFVDHGLLRKGEAEQVERDFVAATGVKLHVVDAQKTFLDALAGVTDPETKRKIIGREFIRAFEGAEAAVLGEAAADGSKVGFLVQGTLYPDVVESGGGAGTSNIKSHHNVGGLPEDLEFELVEPLRTLFKDEVRLVGEQLGLPAEMVWRQPFPGPGLGIRIIGEVTQDRLEILREADAIAREELTRAGLDRHEARDIARFRDGCILVTSTTDPDWVPVMKRAAAIVTDHGGRTSHAAIVSRELGLPAILGTGNATKLLSDGQEITVSCAQGDEGQVYAGHVAHTVEEIRLDSIPETRTQIMLNLADPAAAFQWWRLPADGIGLVRMEFVVNNHVRVHPMALLRYDELPEGDDKARITELCRGYANKADYFVERLALGLARFAALAWPHPAIVRMSDFKTNEYANLLGGDTFEPREENPMLGFRGASRYYSPRYRDAFALECRAIRRLRDDMGLRNVVVMIPFCRTLDEARKVLEVMAENGLRRGERGLQVYVMCEIPSNVVLARRFAELFDGFSIGSNDLTQLTLGVDRDAGDLAPLFSEEDPAVEWMIAAAIEGAHAGGAKVGLCGQAPSDRPQFAAFLVRQGIDSISVSPDSFVAVKEHVAKAEREAGKA